MSAASHPSIPTYAQGDAAHGPYKVNSLVLGADVSPLEGDVKWDPARSLWNAGMLLASLVLAPLFFTWGAFAAFIVLLALTMCTVLHSIACETFRASTDTDLARFEQLSDHGDALSHSAAC